MPIASVTCGSSRCLLPRYAWLPNVLSVCGVGTGLSGFGSRACPWICELGLHPASGFCNGLGFKDDWEFSPTGCQKIIGRRVGLNKESETNVCAGDCFPTPFRGANFTPCISSGPLGVYFCLLLRHGSELWVKSQGTLYQQRGAGGSSLWPSSFPASYKLNL